MRPVARLMLVLVALVALGHGGVTPTAATEPTDHGPVVLIPPTNGTFVAGVAAQRLAGADLDPAEDRVVAGTHHTWSLEATDCHRRLSVNLTYQPGSLMDDPEALVDAPYLFDIAITLNGTTWTHRVFASPENRTIGALPDDGDFTVDLILRQGVNVDWTFTMTARQALNCDGGTPLERT